MGGSKGAMAAVLRDDDLLREILLCLGFPAFLVRAALVSKRWLALAADPAFLRRFRDRHPPRLLGFYIHDACYPRPQFVPVSEAPELRAAVSRAGFDHGDPLVRSFDCRNGLLLLQPVDLIRGQYVVRRLLCPMQSVVPVSPPRLQLYDVPEWLHAYFIRRECFLSRDISDGIVFVYLLLIAGKLSVQVHVLQSGVWGEGIFARGRLPAQVSVSMVMAAHGKLYIETDNACIHGLDFVAPRPQFFTIKLPDVVRSGNYRLSGGVDDGLLIIHGEGFQFSVRRHETDENGEDSWELVDRFRVRTAYDRLEEIVVVGVGDNAELVFLGLQESGAIICVNLRSRKEIIVHEMPVRRLMSCINVFPFMTVWPPVFPAQNDEDDHSE